MSQGIPLHGDRGAWDVMNFDDEHASDIMDSTLRRHLPLPGAAGGFVQSDGTDWIRVDGIDHNDLGSIQGGQAGQYNHLTNAQHTAVAAMVTAGLDALTSAEVDQLENIALTTISAAQWEHLGALDQGLATGDSPTFTGLTIGAAGDILPTDAFGQDLGDVTHWWALYTRDTHYCGATGENWINFPDGLNEALKWRQASGMNYMAIVSNAAQRMVIVNPDNNDIDFIVGAVGAGTGFKCQGSDGQITLGALTAGFIKSSAAGVLSVATDGLSGTLTLDDGANWRITFTFTSGLLTGQTIGATVAATAAWA